MKITNANFNKLILWGHIMQGLLALQLFLLDCLL